ncbi:MAG: type II toxin-antitoxin system HicB family antitoxin [Alphaproteobacteria bacterium]|nr:type II toxin-antitoxin system HicB family antitoxin [Rhodospirillales bacterium]MCW9045307.1 type II toxin-antitoxin system HicB family antitoxin [Alphaproteobacteria bacterium]
MRIMFPAFVHKDKKSEYGISFPDFPGCVSAGETPEDALHQGEQVLQFHVDGMIEDKEALPKPSAIEDIGIGDAVLVALVPVLLPGTKRRYNVTLDEDMVAEIDARTNNRSRFLEQAARQALMN